MRTTIRLRVQKNISKALDFVLTPYFYAQKDLPML
nr:MAG TPA: hypothetical protein [Caudoviricetes sp.]DAO71822.1 MAG TPA: hypothetical protein [Caudoviricetes sp.]